MALTITSTDPRGGTDVEGSRRVWRGTITFDSSYPTGGEAIAAADFGLAQLHHVLLGGISRLGTKLVTWDNANSKLQIWTALGTEATNTSDQSTVVIAATVVGV